MGHSGSTLLDLICGHHPDIFSLGEVQFVSWQLLQGPVKDDPQTYCSCGKSFEKCDFWSDVFSKINSENNINVYKQPAKYDFSINRNLVRYKSNVTKWLINKVLEISIRYNGLNFLSKIPYLIYRKSIERNWDFFDKVAQKSGAEYLVDSSKDFLRFWLLKMQRPESVKLIILIRDIKGAASSSHSGLNQKIIDTRVSHWLKFYNKKLNPAFKMFPDDVEVLKYEDLCQNPGNTLDEISEFLSLKLCGSSLKTISPYKYHTIQGNPMRLIKKDLSIRYDERWRERLTESQINELNRASLKLDKKYGYQ